jgi:hypothetical protein
MHGLLPKPQRWARMPMKQVRALESRDLSGKRVDKTPSLAGGNRKRRYERAVRERDEYCAVQRFCAVTGLSADVLEESGAAAYKAFRAGKLTGKQALLLGVSPAAVRKQEHAR